MQRDFVIYCLRKALQLTERGRYFAAAHYVADAIRQMKSPA